MAHHHPIEFRKNVVRLMFGLILIFSAILVHLGIGWQEAVGQTGGISTVSFLIFLCLSMYIIALLLFYQYLLDKEDNRFVAYLIQFHVAMNIFLSLFFQSLFWYKGLFWIQYSLQIYQVIIASFLALLLSLMVVSLFAIFIGKLSYDCCIRPCCPDPNANRPLVMLAAMQQGQVILVKHKINKTNIVHNDQITIDLSSEQQPVQSDQSEQINQQQSVQSDRSEQQDQQDRRNSISSSDNSNNSFKCSVCLGTIQVGDVCLHLSICQHKYHKDCLDKWLVDHKTCPMCRLPVV